MKKKAGTIWTVLAVGVIYFCWLKVTGIGIPCIFRKITGWYCPGCGITTLILCISEQDFVGGFLGKSIFVCDKSVSSGRTCCRVDPGKKREKDARME